MASKRFTDRIRIDPAQKEWIKKHKGNYKTLAGKLDEIINRYRNESKEGTHEYFVGMSRGIQKKR